MLKFTIIGVALVVYFLLQTNMIFSQQTYKFSNMYFKKSTSVYPRQIEKDWLFELQNLDDIFEGNETYKEFVKEQKEKVYAKYNSKDFIRTDNKNNLYNTVDTPIVNYSFEGNHYSASVPNDNTMAISNDGIVVSIINTNMMFYDTERDTVLKIISLRAFSDTLANVSTHQYDPKAIYDYNNDRFIIVFLAGSGSSASSDIIIGFSTSSNPLDEWNLYSLSGNPLNDTSWSDYPAIALTNNELFITVNLLKTGNGSWQTSFKQSVIWQLKIDNGYNGDSLKTGLYSAIGLDGIPVRNIHPVRGGNEFYGPDLYFLSERNFDIKNDTFFLIHTIKSLDDITPELTIDAIRSDMSYGMPPNARQTNNKFLATNDSRVLGAFYQNNIIQFVGNSVDTLTGHASFYHGFFNPKLLNKKVHLNVISDTLLEFGYPNISYCGNNKESMHSMITFNYTASTVFPGVAAMFFGGMDSDSALYYSVPKILKKGNTPIRILFGTQRWGDYSGSQPRYNRVGEIWACGTYGKLIGNTRGYGTWVVSLQNSVKDFPLTYKNPYFSSKVFPNPSSDSRISVEFIMPKSEEIQIQIFDISGKKIADVYQAIARKGKNILSFSTNPLSSGIYLLLIKNDKEIFKTHKFSIL